MLIENPEVTIEPANGPAVCAVQTDATKSAPREGIIRPTMTVYCRTPVRWVHFPRMASDYTTPPGMCSSGAGTGTISTQAMHKSTRGALSPGLCMCCVVARRAAMRFAAAWRIEPFGWETRRMRLVSAVCWVKETDERVTHAAGSFRVLVFAGCLSAASYRCGLPKVRARFQGSSFLQICPSHYSE